MDNNGDDPAPLAGEGSRNEHAIRGRRRLVENCLHDIQNYLHIIRMEVDLLKLEKHMDFDLRRMFDSIDRASLLVEDARNHGFLDYGVIKSPRSSGSWEHMVRDLSNTLKKQNISVRWLNDMSFPKGVVDSRHIKNVFDRLVEFCDEFVNGGGELDVDGGLKYEGDRRYLEFRFTVLSLEGSSIRRDYFEGQPIEVVMLEKNQLQATNNRRQKESVLSSHEHRKPSTKRATFTLLLDTY